MERRQLEFFLAIVDNGSFTAASRVLRIAQPSLSQAVRSLERELGAQLFHRLPRGVTLTAAGEALVTSARQVARDLAIARSSVEQVVGLASGHLDLVSLPTLALEPLAEIIGRFRVRHPAVEIRLAQPEKATVVLESVRTGAAELGFADLIDTPSEELEISPMGPQEMILTLPPEAAPPSGRVTLHDLLDIPLITGQPGTYTRDLIDRIAHENGRCFQPVVEVERRETSTHLVLAGAGAAVLPSPLAEVTRLRGATLVSLHPPLTRPIAVARRKGPLSPACRTFLDLALTHPD